MSNVSVGDLAYVVAGRDNRADLAVNVGRVVSVKYQAEPPAYVPSTMFILTGPWWYVEFCGGAGTAWSPQNGTHTDKGGIVPDACLRRIAGPGVPDEHTEKPLELSHAKE